MSFSLSSTQDIFFLVAAIAIVWLTIFACWALFELARLLKQSNLAMEKTCATVGRVDAVVNDALDKVEDGAEVVGYAIEGGKQLLSFFSKRSSKKFPKRRRRFEEELEEEDEND